jgi:4-aminobutyrate aminotransferase
VRFSAAVATIDTILEEKLAENAEERGKQLVAGLKKLQQKYPLITDVRGLGLMVQCFFFLSTFYFLISLTYLAG